MKTLHDFIQELNASFINKQRPDGTSFYCAKDNAPAYIQELCHAIHDGMMPDDYKYQYLVETLEYLNDNVNALDDSLDDLDLFEVAEPEVYTHELLQWVGSNLQRIGYCDEAIEDFEPSHLMNILIAGQQAERLDVAQATVDWIESQSYILWDSE